MSRVYDYAIIGSSPLLVLHALTLAKSGKRVVLFEAKNKIGGCWENESGMQLESMENGTHMFFHRQKSQEVIYDKLRDELGVQFAEMKPFPHLFFRKGLPIFPLESPQTDLLKEFFRIQDLETNALAKVLPLLKVAVKFTLKWPSYALLRVQGDPRYRYKYLVQGTLDLVGKMEQQIAKTSGIELKLGHSVIAVRGDSTGELEVETDQGTFSAGKLVMTAGAKLERFEWNGSEIRVPFFSKHVQHINFRVRDQGPTRFSFVEFHGRKHLRWLTDITASSAHPSPGERILCVRLNASIDSVELSRVALEIFHEIVEAGYLSPKAELLEQKLLTYPTIFREDEEIEKLNRTLPSPIRMLYSRFLFDSIERATN